MTEDLNERPVYSCLVGEECDVICRAWLVFWKHYPVWALSEISPAVTLTVGALMKTSMDKKEGF